MAVAEALRLLLAADTLPDPVTRLKVQNAAGSHVQARQRMPARRKRRLQC